MTVTVWNPDDPFGSPAYEGPADKAHTALSPGSYTASVVSNDEDLNGTEVLLQVFENSSAADASYDTKTR